MEEIGWDLLITLIGVVAAKALDELVEFLKEKTSGKRGKHSKRS